MRIQLQPGVERIAEPASAEISEICPRDHQAIRAWKRLRPNAPEPERVEVLKFKNAKKSIVYRLSGGGPGGTPVIAKRCQEHMARAERFIYEQVLPVIWRRPALEYYGCLIEPDERYCWLFLEEAQGEPYSPLDKNHRALAGRWLAEMHQADLPAEIRDGLPSHEPAYYLQSLRDCRRILRDHLTHNPALPKDAAALFNRMARTFDVLESQWSNVEKLCGAMPWTLVHGDFVTKNMRVKDGAFGPELLVFDWELAGWGVPATDLAQFVHRGPRPDLNAYWSSLKRAHLGLNFGDIQGVAACGNIFRLVEELRWSMMIMDFASRDFLTGPVCAVQSCENPLVEALQGIERVR